jgi:hypothetical protein
MKMKTLIIQRDNRQYQCEVTGGDFFGEANITIKEIIYPDRKFLRTEMLGYTKTINLDAYSSILKGVERAVDKYHAEKTREERIRKMWEEFEKNP